jgi:hypothetical protein
MMAWTGLSGQLIPCVATDGRLLVFSLVLITTGQWLIVSLHPAFDVKIMVPATQFKDILHIYIAMIY